MSEQNTHPDLREYPFMRGIDPLLATGTLLNIWRHETTTDGDLRFLHTADNGNTQTRAILSPQAFEIARSNPFFLSFIDNAPHFRLFRTVAHGAQSSAIIKRSFTTSEGVGTVAVKNLHQEMSHCGSGIELFLLFRELQKAGVLTAEPILASDRVLVTEWLDGKKIGLGSNLGPFDEYIASLDTIFAKIPVPTPNVRHRYAIDRSTENVIIINESDPDPLKRYKTFDPLVFLDWRINTQPIPAPL